LQLLSVEAFDKVSDDRIELELAEQFEKSKPSAKKEAAKAVESTRVTAKARAHRMEDPCEYKPI
jgi:hypothetical protein